MGLGAALNRWFHRGPDVSGVYNLAVGRARAPVFYRDLGVPDTVEGRFEMIALHVHLLCRRLTAAGKESGETAQALFDHMFLDMDRNLREMGTGDLVVGKRIKKMAHDYYGRAAALEEALAAEGPDGPDGPDGPGRPDGEDPLVRVLERNVYAAGAADAPRLAAYVRGAAAALPAGADPLTAPDEAALFGPLPA